MRVLKFGGTSVESADRIMSVAEVVHVSCEQDRVAVVVSALAGVTNTLHKAAQTAADRDEQYIAICEALRVRHEGLVKVLSPEDDLEAILGVFQERFTELRDLLHGVYLLRECTPRILDSVLSYGECFSAEIVASALRRRGIQAISCDARALIATDSNFGHAHVQVDETFDRIRNYFKDTMEVQVVTGFIGATPEGRTTTLGRGGSDYTAALIGAAMRASVIEIWTDVDGVMSADPRIVPEALTLDQLSYAELMELSHFGAKVVYPLSVHPARQYSIPLLIKNTLNPNAPGSSISERVNHSYRPVRGVSSINRVFFMRLEGDGMLGTPGIAGRLFGALSREEVNVILITQASSEHSICFAVSPDDADRAQVSVDQEFALERRLGIIDPLVVEGEVSVIAVVGEGMREHPGIAGRIFSTLGAAGVNVRAIAQGSSELNVSLVVARSDEVKSVRAIHGAFFSTLREVEVVVAGAGKVGSALIEELYKASTAHQDAGNRIKVIGIYNSGRMLIQQHGIDLTAWRGELETSAPLDLSAVREVLTGDTHAARVFCDCTASNEVPVLYNELVGRGITVITANKIPFSQSWGSFVEMLRSAKGATGELKFESVVGGGLPVIATLERLIESGDSVREIVGTFSGTLGYVTSRLEAGEGLREAIEHAIQAGLAEPHPRDDLSGADTARKILILARLAGAPLELEDVDTEEFVAGAGACDDVQSLVERMGECEARLGSRVRDAMRNGRRLRYVARLREGCARVCFEEVDETDPCFYATGTSIAVAFYTARYKHFPLVVAGPGAGPEVTAGGMLAQLVRAGLR